MGEQRDWGAPTDPANRSCCACCRSVISYRRCSSSWEGTDRPTRYARRFLIPGGPQDPRPLGRWCVGYHQARPSESARRWRPPRVVSPTRDRERPAIVGLGVALSIRSGRLERIIEATRKLRNAFERRLLDSGLAARINGGAAERLTNTTNVRFANVDGEALVIRLDGLGVRCSQNSACTSQKPEPSYVLRAMGLTEPEAFASIRFSFSEYNTMDDVEYVLGCIAQLHPLLSTFAMA